MLGENYEVKKTTKHASLTIDFMQKYRNYLPHFSCACQNSLGHLDTQILLQLKKNQNECQSNQHFK